MDFLKLGLSYLTSISDGEFYVLNTNCSWWVWQSECLMAATFKNGFTVIVPMHMTEESLKSLEVEGHEVEVIKVMKCRDGIGHLVHFKIR